jgi:DNA replication protein DnaC
MLNQQTIDKLHALRLEAMVQALQEQRQQSNICQLDFEDRLALLVERQWLWKENRGLAARLHSAQFKVSATLEDIDYEHPRGLKRAQIEQLRASQWVEKHRNCLITGPTGCGKTHLACALGHQACREGHRVCYYYGPKLFRELQNAQVDGSMMKLLKKLSNAALLILDDFGLSMANGKQYRDLLEIIDDRYGQGQHSSPASFQRTTGMSLSMMPQWPMPYWIGWYTMPIGSNLKAKPFVRSKL